jgi:very-short-patch-repair endonuclease
MQSPSQLQKYKKQFKRKPTESEKLAEIKLKETGIEYKKQMILGFYILDFVIPNKLLNIEIDGGYHSDNKMKDYLRDKFVCKCGFSVIRIKNEGVNKFDFNSLHKYPDLGVVLFRRGLALANSYRGVAIRKNKLKNLENNP